MSRSVVPALEVGLAYSNTPVYYRPESVCNWLHSGEESELFMNCFFFFLSLSNTVIKCSAAVDEMCRYNTFSQSQWVLSCCRLRPSEADSSSPSCLNHFHSGESLFQSHLNELSGFIQGAGAYPGATEGN